MELLCKQIAGSANSTASILYADGRFLCFILEDGHRDKKIAGETRIPEGRYKILPRREGSFFTKYANEFGHKFVPWLQDVPNFAYILMHTGNRVQDTRGCLLVNNYIGINPNGDFEGRESTAAYKCMYRMMELAYDRGEEIYITIQRQAPMPPTPPVP